MKELGLVILFFSILPQGIVSTLLHCTHSVYTILHTKYVEFSQHFYLIYDQSVMLTKNNNTIAGGPSALLLFRPVVPLLICATCHALLKWGAWNTGVCEISMTQTQKGAFIVNVAKT